MLGKDLIMSTLLGGGSSGGGGGGSVAVSPKEVNFYDYDGTCVHAYTVAEAQALSALPDGPVHDGLVFQGWNWSLEGVKGLTRAMNIGAMYTTDDGTTRLYITLQEGRTSPMLGVGVNGTVTVDWGDGTEPDVLTGTSTSTTKWTPNHAYAKPGDYVIRLTVDGEMSFTGTATTNQFACILRNASEADSRNKIYLRALQKVEIGSGAVTLSSHAFNSCYSLQSVSIPEGVTDIGTYAFNSCYSLQSVSIPEGVTGISNYLFTLCKSLQSVSIPEGVTDIGTYAFNSCCSLQSVSIPEGVTDIGQRAFMGNYCLLSASIPEGVTGIATFAFNSCFSMASVTFHGDVTSIAASAFSGCNGVHHYDFTACTAVPTLSNTNAFTGIPADCEIRVPAALYDEWIAATNWATYADKIKAY